MTKKIIARFCQSCLLVLCLFTVFQGVAYAQVETILPIDTGDTAWVLMSSALVMLMTPGLAFFYGGLVSKKNMLSVLMKCFMVLALISIQWVLFGYSLAFGPDVGGFIGNLSWLGLYGVGLDPNPDYAATIPHQAFMIFQAKFAIITPALIIGAFVERIKFFSFCIFALLWATFVYSPIAHSVWAVGGFLRGMGALDFAGGTVVHISAGFAALATALVLGKRSGYLEKSMPPHNLPLAVLGAALLWFGWFGFNAGSALSASGLATNAFVVTNVAAAAAALFWSLMEWVLHKRPTTMGIITGLVAGLVAITPAAGFVTAMAAIWIGFGASFFSYLAVNVLKRKYKYDDSLDAFGVHGIAGMWGALATGIFASKAINAAGADGLLYGNAIQLWIQLKAVLITAVFAFVASYILLKIVDMVFGLRVTKEEEEVGLDATQHGEKAYQE